MNLVTNGFLEISFHLQNACLNVEQKLAINQEWKRWQYSNHPFPSFIFGPRQIHSLTSDNYSNAVGSSFEASCVNFNSSCAHEINLKAKNLWEMVWKIYYIDYRKKKNLVMNSSLSDCKKVLLNFNSI